MIRVGVLTASDRSSRGEREDVSGKIIAAGLAKFSAGLVDYVVVPDNREEIACQLQRMADGGGVDLILTTGGTGFSPRDNTPEATKDVLEREIPGIPEFLRRCGSEVNPRAILSRGVAGLRGKVLIINLPGSPRGVEENLTWLLPILPHALQVAAGKIADCAEPMKKD